MTLVRRLLSEDCAAALQINAESLPGVARLDRAEFERLLDLPNCHLAIEASDGSLVGYALGFPFNAPYDGEEFLTFRKAIPVPFLYIDQVAVRANRRRTGVASALYDALEAKARSEAMPSLCCEVNLSPPNPTSLAFHRSIGFEEIAVLETIDHRTVSLMRKSVA